MAILNDLLVNGISRFIGGVIMPATNVTSSTTYYPVLATGTSTSLFVDTNKSGFSFTKVDGTTGAEGTATLTLGNTTASGTAGNASGRIALYDYYGTAAIIQPRAGVGHANSVIMNLPNWGSGSAEYLIASTSSSAVGGANQPVYVDASGHVQACNTYPTNTDEKLALNLLTSGTTYQVLLGTGNTAAIRQRSGDLTFLYNSSNATSILTIGESGSGQICFREVVNRDSRYTYLRPAGSGSTGSANALTVYLPYNNLLSGAQSHYLISATQRGTAIGSSTKSVYIDTTGVVTAGSTYAGGTAVTLNGTSAAGSTASFYAPTTAGTSGYVLTSSGSGAPTWQPNSGGGGTITGGGISGYLAQWTGTSGQTSTELTAGPMIGTGTTKFLREDGTWQVPSGGGGTVANVSKTFSGTSSTAASTAVKVVDCSDFTASDLVMGTVIYVVFSVKNTAAVASVALDVNSTGSHLIRQLLRNGAQITLQDPGYLPASIPIPFYFDGTYWVALMNYDANTTTQLINRRLCTNSTAGSTYRYEIMLFDYRGYVFPINNTSNAPTSYTKTLTTNTFDPFKGAMYYTGTTTISAGTSRDANEFASKYAFDVRYALNIRSDGTAGSTALAGGKPVYLKAKYNIDTKVAILVPIAGNNYLNASSITQDLPTTDPDTALASNERYIYILLGMAYSKYQLDMWQNKPVLAWNPIIGKCDNFNGEPFSGSGTFTAYYGTNSATWTYVKQGRLVTVQGKIPNGTTMAASSVTSLPFAASGNQKIMAAASHSSHLIHSLVISLSDGGTSFTPLTMLYSTTGGTSHTAMNSATMIFYTCGDSATTVNFTYVTNY